MDPGIYTQEQIEGWKKVTKAVHNKEEKIFAQLWHVGRVSHASLQKNGESPVSSSPILAEGVKVFLAKGCKEAISREGEMIQTSQPRELTITEIKQVIQECKSS